MPNRYFCSDHHFGHQNILKFKRGDGSPLRTKKGLEFSCIEEHDEYLIERHNSVVREQDVVYFLGDFCINQKGLKYVERLNGSKRLIRGNHDIFHMKEYINRGFKEIYGIRVFTPKEADGIFFCATHVPVHPSALYRWSCNLHGHTHSNLVMLEPKKKGSTNLVKDVRYLSACMEQLDDYTPLHMEQVVNYIKANKLVGGSY